MRANFNRLTGVARAQPVTLEVKGRKVAVREAASGVARLSFDDCASKPLGALDYLHIAHAYHTVVIEGIPRLTPTSAQRGPPLHRLIDTLYDCASA